MPGKPLGRRLWFAQFAVGEQAVAHFSHPVPQPKSMLGIPLIDPWVTTRLAAVAAGSPATKVVVEGVLRMKEGGQLLKRRLVVPAP